MWQMNMVFGINSSRIVNRKELCLTLFYLTLLILNTTAIHCITYTNIHLYIPTGICYRQPLLFHKCFFVPLYVDKIQKSYCGDIFGFSIFDSGIIFLATKVKYSFMTPNMHKSLKVSNYMSSEWPKMLSSSYRISVYSIFYNWLLDWLPV